MALNELVEVVRYDPAWITSFESEAGVLRATLGSEVVAIHHIGSTSIPGMRAKPIVDLLLEVRDLQRLEDATGDLLLLGYQAKGEYGLPGRRFFPKRVEGVRLFNLHAWQAGHPEVGRHLAFRDYMITYSDKALAYGDLKAELARQFDGDRPSYVAGKDDFVKAAEAAALTWQAEFNKETLSTSRIRLLPLTPAQLYLCLHRLEQLEAELRLRISPTVLSPPAVNAISTKLVRMEGKRVADQFWHTYWLIAGNDGRAGLGLIGFKGVPDEQGRVEIGYGIDRNFRNQGIATEAADALIAWAARHESCRAVLAWTELHNEASIRVLGKLGFSRRGETDGQLLWELRI
jgi:GrpB-like predicted nucleotidyltransferase (UPF0157 family)/RimJ/RimL family protein N-acetyltransferase